MAIEFAHENIWFDKWRADDAEREFYEKKCLPALGLPCSRSTCTSRPTGTCKVSDEPMMEVCGEEESCNVQENGGVPQESSSVVAEGGSGLGTLANQIAKARQEIQNSLASGGRGGSGGASADVLNRITKLEGDNAFLNKKVSSLEQTILNLAKQLEALQCRDGTTAPAPVTQKEEVEDDDDDEVDLFGSDDEEEDEEAARVREERLKAYTEKKSKKPGPIAKSSVLLDCKPWDDETDMKVMEDEVRKIGMDGLTWGAAKLQPLAYGIQKLSILCIVEDEKVSIDDLSEKIQEIEDYVQSVDIAAFNKI